MRKNKHLRKGVMAIVLSWAWLYPGIRHGMGACSVKQEPADARRAERITMENDFVRIAFDTENEGARCREYIIKSLTRNLIFETKAKWSNNRGVEHPYERAWGYFVDRLGEFHVIKGVPHGGQWPQYAEYRTRIVEATTNRAVVEFSTVPNWDGIEQAPPQMGIKPAIYRQMTFTKRITLSSESPLVRVEHVYRNFGSEVPITPWVECRLNTQYQQTLYAPGSEQVHWLHATHEGASAQVDILDPSAGWVGFLQRDGIGGVMFADDPSMVDIIELWAGGRDRSEDGIGIQFNQFDVTVDGGELVVGYYFGPLLEMPRLDGVNAHMACGIDLRGGKSSKIVEPKWSEQAQTSYRRWVYGFGACAVACPWLKGEAVKPGDEVEASVHFVPWRNQELDLVASLRSLDDDSRITVASRHARLETLRPFSWEMSFKAPPRGSYVVEVVGKSRDNAPVELHFERPFAVVHMTRPYKTSPPSPRKGQPFLSKTAFGFRAPEKSITSQESARAVTSRGPCLFQFFSEPPQEAWPGMKAVMIDAAYDSARGFGWIEPPQRIQPIRGFQKDSPDFLGSHGVRGGTFAVEVADGDYEIALLSNQLRDPKLLPPPDRTLHEKVVSGGQVLHEYRRSYKEEVDAYYFGMTNMLRKTFDVWDEYIAPNLREIRFRAPVTNGVLKLSFSGFLLNAMLVYPAAEAARLTDTLAALRKERKANSGYQTVALSAEVGAPPSPEEKERGYRIVALSPLQDEGSPFSFPWKGPNERDLRRKFDYTAAQDMWLAFRIGVQAFKDLNNARLRPGALTNESGVALPGGCVRVGVYKYFPTPANLLKPDTLLRMPSGIEALRQVPIDAGINTYFWSVIRLGPGTVPGCYRGVYLFEADNAPPQQIPVTVTVHPFRLQRPLLCWWNCVYPNYPGASLDAFLDDMHEHGVTVIRLYPRANEYVFSLWSDDPYDPTGRRIVGAEEFNARAKAKGYEFAYCLMTHEANKQVTSLIASNAPGWTDALNKEEERLEQSYMKARQDFERSNLGIAHVIPFTGEGSASREDGVWMMAALRAAKKAGALGWSFDWVLAWNEPTEAAFQYIQHTAVTPFLSDEGWVVRRRNRIANAVQYFGSNRDECGFNLYRWDLKGTSEEGWGVSQTTEGNYPLHEMDKYWWNWCRCAPTIAGPAPLLGQGSRWEKYREGTTDYAFLWALKTVCEKVRGTGKPGAAEAAEAGMTLITDTLAELAKTPNDNDRYDEARRIFAERTVQLLKQYGP